ncbi:EAL domain-containing protein [Leptolyngbya iicbica]|uniref:EAL domain-containing protein n=2 Tax=Cyanophyceae TaxID=3028117 RepID=A0A4Q7E2L2_9CYAN|nr:EAL domain-containing protein [Leptolyngbya sp. LK]RZM75699.1 EAL domain-containing protein [Leptolyngbya sp. LK]
MLVSLRWLKTIRSQLLFGFGAILLVSFTSSAIGYRSLAQLRNTSQTLLERSARVRELSLELQRNFLTARHTEEVYLNSWKDRTAPTDAQTLVSENQAALSAARANLAELTQLEGPDSDLAPELALLQSLFLNYESAFKTTTLQIQTSAQDYALEDRLQQLFATIAATNNNADRDWQTTLWMIAAKEQAYFNSGDAQYLTDVRNELEQLATAYSPTAAPDLSREVEDYLADLNTALLLEQQIEVNTIVADSINRDIDRIIHEIEAITQTRAQQARLELAKTARQSNAALLATALTALGLTVWASLWLSSRILRPITALKTAAERVSAGDLNTQLQLASQDEFAIVAATFNQMVAQLRHTLVDLETRIAERTVALETSNQSLEEKTQSLEQTLKQLRDSENNYRSLLEHLQAGVVVHDRDTHIVLCNQMAAQLLGIAADQLLGRGASHLAWPLIDELEAPLTVDQYPVNQVISTQQPLHNYVVGIQQGDPVQTVWVLVNAFPVLDDQLTLQQVVVTFSDITERKHNEEKLRHRALHDVLTNLPNRTLLVERLEHALQQNRRQPDQQCAVLFIDLNRFKVINDSLGHAIGDQLLIKVAKILLAQVRNVDTVARLGGDEFVILLEQVQSVQEVIHVVERIQTQLQRPMTLRGYTMFTSASIGIALSNNTYQRGHDILRDADNAMYRAKAKGESGYEIFNPEMHARAMQLLNLETDLRRAIADQAFCLRYQPIVDLASGKIIGFESLVRWQHPDRGLVSPDQFIPLAEETGLIIPLSEWIVRSACEQMSLWSRDPTLPADFTMSVNIAAASFQNPRFVHELDQALTQTQLSPSRLKLEVTESVLLENIDSVRETLAQLKQRQIEISLDDFGTGYSSLSYLKQLPIDTLKIDKSFIDSLTEDGDASLVEAIIQIANSLTMTVVAEGVETAMQRSRLQQLGCGAIQGYLISPPMDGAAAENFMRTFQPHDWQHG